MSRDITRVLLLGGTSEIGLAIVRALALPPHAQVILAGRSTPSLSAVAASLPVATAALWCDALAPDTVSDVVAAAFAEGPVDVVVSAFGVLGDQSTFDADPARADELLTVNVVAQTRALLESAKHLRGQGHGSLIVLSSVAAVRPRRANYVYGASKATIDALGRGLQDALYGTGVDVLVVRPGFVIGRMTRGLRPAPLATTPEVVGAAVAKALRDGRTVVWVPASLRVLAVLLRLLPGAVWRRLRH